MVPLVSYFSFNDSIGYTMLQFPIEDNAGVVFLEFVNFSEKSLLYLPNPLNLGKES